jgi:hypothetical protein
LERGLFDAVPSSPILFLSAATPASEKLDGVLDGAVVDKSVIVPAVAIGARKHHDAEGEHYDFLK